MSVLELPELETVYGIIVDGGSCYITVEKLRYVNYTGIRGCMKGILNRHLQIDTNTIVSTLSSDDSKYTISFINSAENLNTLIFSDDISFTVGGNGNQSQFIICNCPQLRTVKFMGNIVHNFQYNKLFMKYCDNLYHLCFNKIPYTTNDNFIDYSSIKNTIKVEILSQIDKFRILWWNPSNALDSSKLDLIEDQPICQNNLEQFLYNFREYIVKRLETKSTKTYIYLHATTKSYIEGDYAKSWIVPGESQTYYASLDLLLQEKNWGLA